MKKQPAFCGSWRSPIQAELVAESSHELGQLVVERACLYWIEQFPQQKGRRALLCRDAFGEIRELTDRNFNVRNRVHEYGGGDYCVHQGVLYFSNDRDQRWYRKDAVHLPEPITPKPEKPMALRYADAVITPDGHHLMCVRETHHASGAVINEIISITTDGCFEIKVLATGADFYAAPRLNARGDALIYLSWNHPEMPWDGTKLYIQKLAYGEPIGEPHCIAGGREEALSQPSFHPSGDIYFMSDRSNFWNLYRYAEGQITPVFTIEAELASAMWVFAMTTYVFINDCDIVCIVNQNGHKWLALWQEGVLSEISTEYDEFYPTLAVAQGQLYCIAASGALAPALVQIDLKTRSVAVIHSSSNLLLDAAYFSLPERMTFPTEHGLEAYAYYYAPQNPYFDAMPGELPPLMVLSHGGPTSAASTALNLKIQYWTTRGFAVVDVNYGGSVGYGRAYRQRLRGQWGIVDVADCVNAANDLVRRGKVDGQRLLIKGSSAGGFTTLCALTFFGIFSVGTSYYGVADLEGLISETHKFESHYLEQLIGPYPQAATRYKELSPVHHADRLTCPIIFLQGLEDKVVPPAQTEAMIQALEKKQLPYAYVVFPHEQHGFRDSQSIKKSLEAELSFYAQIFAFKPQDALEPLFIHYFPRQ